MNELPRNITSLEVAEMVGRDHNEVLKDVRRIISQLAEGEIPQGEYFIESTYIDANKQKRPSFLITKKGCELYGTRMTGARGTQFAVKYIERFNQMESHIKQLPKDPIELALEASLKNYQEIKDIKEDVDLLKDSMRIDGRQEHTIKSQGKAKVMETLGGYNSPAYNALSKKVFSRMWRDFNNYFILPRSTDLPKVRFDEAVKFIAMWRPDTSIAMEIESYNSQTELKLIQ